MDSRLCGNDKQKDQEQFSGSLLDFSLQGSQRSHRCYFVSLATVVPKDFLADPHVQPAVTNANKKGGFHRLSTFYVTIMLTCCRCRREGIDAYPETVAVLSLKGHGPVDEGKKGVIFAFPHIDSGVEPGPPLSHKDIACAYKLTSEPFYSEPLGLAVTAVP